jgi:hypothetical protein
MTLRAAAAAAAAALAACGVAGFAAAVSPAAPTRSQEFFRKEILADRGTSDAIVDLLRQGGGFVAKKVTFADLTGDDRQDAIVRVHSGGAAGVVALFVFSTHGQDEGAQLRVLYRRQTLVGAAARIRKDGLLSFTSSVYADGDEVCCPSETTTTVLEWDAKAEKFRVKSGT